VTRSDAPAGSGLGGSGALGVALVAAMDKLGDHSRLPAEIAGAAFEIETIEAGIVGGSQDQYAAAMGGFQFLVYGDPAVTSMRPNVPIPCRRELEQALVLCYTGATRFSSETHGRVWSAFDRGERATRVALDGLRSCAHRMREALEAGDVAQVADVLNENWTHQRALEECMETPEIRRLGQIGFDAGADGMKACGAGAGGCIALLAKPGREFDVAEALRAAGGVVLRAGFDYSGVTVWEALER
jgi:D-glycero-alpha-D-manno-heptose-7-phosphate kinase